MLDTSAKPAPAEPKTPGGAASSGRELANEQKAIALYRQGKAVEAASEFDKLIAEKPNEAGPKIWKALAQLEQARGMREARSGPYRPLVLSAWAALKGVQKVQPPTPEWNLAVGKALWLNERHDRGKGFVQEALKLRPDYAEAYLLLGDMAYDEWVTSRNADTANRWGTSLEARKQYEAAMALPDLPSELRAEALFKLGMALAEVEGKKKEARAYWEKAAADSTSRYGRLAQEKLRTLAAE
jgi:tetratricopeptide (TPR) repeat protein